MEKWRDNARNTFKSHQKISFLKLKYFRNFSKFSSKSFPFLQNGNNFVRLSLAFSNFLDHLKYIIKVHLRVKKEEHEKFSPKVPFDSHCFSKPISLDLPSRFASRLKIGYEFLVFYFWRRGLCSKTIIYNH